jgi:hypothetical protein
MGGSTTPRRNYQGGAFGTGQTMAQLGNLSFKDLLGMQETANKKELSGLDSLRDINKLSVIGNLAGNVLPNVERGGFKGVIDFLKDPGTTQAAIAGLAGEKKIDLQEGQIKGKQFDKYISGRATSKQLDIAEKKAMQETATALKQRLAGESRKLLAEYGSVDQMPPQIRQQYYDSRKIAVGDLTPSEAIRLATAQVGKDYPGDEISTSKRKTLIKEMAESFLATLDLADGGRVDRQMGSSMMGEQPMQEQPMQQETQMSEQPMQPEGQQDPYQYLRTKLPAEIPDQVVKLIAYNQEAFNDFAAIETQDDLDSFNKRYNVELVVNV